MTTNIDAITLDYQVAVLLSQRDTINVGGAPGGAIQAVTGRLLGHRLFTNMYDIYGDTSPSAVANSQLHYGSGTPVFIEDQPLWRGSVVGDVLAASWAYQGVKLLVNNFNRNDFGDTHSLVLIVDSMIVQSTLARLSPSSSASTLDRVLRSASNRIMSFSSGTQGQAEHDTLERVVTALGEIFNVTTSLDWTRLNPNPSGGTWASIESGDGYTGRAALHGNLKAITESPAFRNLVQSGQVTIEARHDAGRARGDFAALLSLTAGATFSLKLSDPSPSSAGTAALATHPSYQQWLDDRNLVTNRGNRSGLNFTDEYLKDRSVFLNALAARNQSNVQGVLSGAQVGLSVQEQTVFTDAAGESQFVVGGSGMPTDPSIRKQMWFGGDLSESFTGSGRDDRLYGGGNNDTLTGGDGADWLEGQTGNDSLVGGDGIDTLWGGAGDDVLEGGANADYLKGGAGTDTYRFLAEWGADTIDDSDGQGSLWVEGIGTLSAGAARRVDDESNVWQTEDERLTFAKVVVDGNQQHLDITIRFDTDGDGHFDAARGMTIRNWQDGQLGLTLGTAVAEPEEDRNVFHGDNAKKIEGGLYTLDSRGNYEADGVQIDAQDMIRGTSEADTIYGAGGNDGLEGRDGDDVIEGGDGHDVIFGGWGGDTINGGEGNDHIYGSANGNLWHPRDLDFRRVNAPSGYSLVNQGFSWQSYRQDGAGPDGERWHGITGVNPYSPNDPPPGAPTPWADMVTQPEGSSNVIDGGAGNDTILAGAWHDVVRGGSGEDQISGLDGADTLFGDEDNDVIFGDGPAEGAAAVTPQWHGDDLLSGGMGLDTLVGQGGNDDLYGGGDNDVMWGDDRVDDARLEDTPILVHGNDTLDGGAGNDSLEGGGRDDLLFGGIGNDSLWGDLGSADAEFDDEYHGDDYLDGEDGDDYLEGGGGHDLIVGGIGADNIVGDGPISRTPVSVHGDDTMEGGAGNDSMAGFGGNDMLEGGADNDQMQGDAAVAFLEASAHGDDFLDGGSGNDTLHGGGGADYLAGGDGNDWLAGEDESAIDASSTLQGADTLFGGSGEDTLVGGNGADVLEGGTGKDALAGGAGSDTYLLQAGDGVAVGDVHESIRDSAGANTVRFGAGVSLGGMQVVPTINTQDLLLRYTASDTVYIVGGLGSTISRFEFADGSSYSARELVGRIGTGTTAGTTAGGVYTAMGGAGDDSIATTSAGSEMSGGLGTDSFVASGGGHTYHFSRGDGQDSITDTRSIDPGTGLPQAAGRVVFGSGIWSQDVSLAIDSGLVLRVGPGSGDSVRLVNFNPQDALAALPPIDRFEFADGTALTLAQLLERGFDHAGSSGNDTLVGTSVQDRYTLGPATGQDTIDDHAGSADDTLRVTSGALPADTTFMRSGNDLVMRDASGANRVTVLGHYAGAGIERVEFADGTVWGRTDIDAHLTNELSESSDVFTGTAGNDIISARGGHDSVSGVGGDDRIDGGNGNDTLRGGDGNDTLVGGLGMDSLYGEAGANTLDGRGDGATDGMIGSTGADTYLFGRGSGLDWIQDIDAGSSVDVVRFDADIAPGDITVGSDGYRFDLNIAGTSDTLRLQLSADRTDARIERLEFADGTVWDDAALRSRYFAGVMTNLSDSISGWDISNDDIDGGLGDDTLLGGAGNDTLRNGEYMYGGTGSDTYVLPQWSGHIRVYETAEVGVHVDAIVLPASVAPATFNMVWANDDLLFVSGNQIGSLRVSQFFATPSGGAQVEEFRFADSTVWTAADLFARRVATSEGNDTAVYGFRWSDTIDGLGGDDQIWGREAADVLSGGAGNDTLYGDSSSAAGAGDGDDSLDGGAGTDSLCGAGGNDTYLFGRGRGSDTVVEAAGTDRVLLDTGVLPADVSLFRMGNHLVLAVDQGPALLTVQNHFSGTANQIESIAFADGTVWDAAGMQSRTITGSANAMTGTTGNDTFVVDHEGDTISESANGGTDLVQSSIQQYTLGANLENLTLAGFLNTSGYGNTLANALTGNGGHNLLVGAEGADTLVGGAGDDTLHGNINNGGDDGSADQLQGGVGDDVYYVSTGTTAVDAVIEGAGQGTDTIQLTADGPVYNLPGHVENLTVWNHTYIYSSRLNGNALDNVITGPLNRSGYVIDGGAGADTMIGSNLGTTYYVDNLGDRIVGTSGSVFSSVEWTLANGFSALTLTGSASVGGTGNYSSNTLDGSQNSAANVLAGGLGDDIYRLGQGDVVVEAANAGYDTALFAGPVGSYSAGGFANVENVQLDDSAGSSTLVGGAADDRLVGNNAANVLRGEDGNDHLTDQVVNTFYNSDADQFFGGTGNDTLVANYGYDTLVGGAGDDSYVIGAQAWATVQFGHGAGHDTAPGSAGSISLVLDAGIEPHQLTFWRSGASLVAQLNDGVDTLTIDNFFVDATSTQPRNRVAEVRFADGTTLSPAQLVMRVNAGSSNVGGPLSDLMIGTSAGDALDAREGDDVLWGRAGNDSLTGGTGNDRLEGQAGADIYTFARGDGQDTVVDDPGSTIAFGPNIANTDLVLTRAGGDLVIGISGTADQITVLGFVGLPNVDLRFADGSTMSAAAIHDLLSTITGTSGADSLVGDFNAERLFGLGGNDTLVGNDGNDTLDGGSGNDSMVGGPGNDVYLVDSTTDSVVEGSGAGIDTVQTTVTLLSTLANNVENLTLLGTSALNATGNTLANLIVGNSAANSLSGGTGADTLQGGAGNDSYTVDNTGDVVVELANEGADSVSASVTYTLSSDVENLTLTGTSGLQGTGNASANLLTGNSGANRLTGLGGNDTLDGGSGNDTMLGGAGDDSYYVNVSTDTVTEVTGEGVDTIVSSVTLTLSSSSEVENLTLGGTSTIHGTGNTLANLLTGNSANNTLTGNAGNDTLDGGAGTDSMVGGAGDDTYYVERTADVVTETSGNGTDTVVTTVTLSSLAANVENLTLGGSSTLNGTGNTLANLLTGNGAANTLTDSTGNDTFVGGAGNDTLNDTSTSSNDIYRWGIGQGNDAITDAGGSADRIEMGAGVVSSQVVLTRSGNHLQVSITGASDVLTVNNWYTSSANRIEEIRLADGSTINLGGAAPASLMMSQSVESRETLQMRSVLPVAGTEERRVYVRPTGAGGDADRGARLLLQAMAQFDGDEHKAVVPAIPPRARDWLRVDLATPL